MAACEASSTVPLIRPVVLCAAATPAQASPINNRARTHFDGNRCLSMPLGGDNCPPRDKRFREVSVRCDPEAHQPFYILPQQPAMRFPRIHVNRGTAEVRRAKSTRPRGAWLRRRLAQAGSFFLAGRFRRTSPSRRPLAPAAAARDEGRSPRSGGGYGRLFFRRDLLSTEAARNRACGES